MEKQTVLYIAIGVIALILAAGAVYAYFVYFKSPTSGPTPPPLPVNCVVSEWSPWGECSPLPGDQCGASTKTRTRTVHNGTCNDALSQTEACNIPCMVIDMRTRPLVATTRSVPILPNTDFTFSLWAYTKRNLSRNDNNMDIMRIDDIQVRIQYEFFTFQQGAGEPNVVGGNTMGHNFTRWNFYTITRKANGNHNYTYHMYVNGVKASGPASRTVTPEITEGVLSLFGKYDKRVFQSMVKDVSVHSKCLTETQVLQMFNAGAPLNLLSVPQFSQNLEGYWRFQGNGRDASGKDRHLSFTDPPIYTAATIDATTNTPTVPPEAI